MNKYQLKITANELSIRPYFGYLPKIRVLAFLFVLTFSALPFFRNLLTTDIIRVIIALGGIFLFYIVYDYLFHVNVVFLFDKRTKAIYRLRGIVFKKRIMDFDEMTILTNSEYGSITYAIGIKKKQFEKNYSISDTFNNNKKGRIREEEYVEKILNPILAFVKN